MVMEGREVGSSFSFLVTVSTSQGQVSPVLRPRMVLGVQNSSRAWLFLSQMQYFSNNVSALVWISCSCHNIARPTGPRTEAAHGLGGSELAPRMVFLSKLQHLSTNLSAWVGIFCNCCHIARLSMSKKPQEARGISFCLSLPRLKQLLRAWLAHGF